MHIKINDNPTHAHVRIRTIHITHSHTGANTHILAQMYTCTDMHTHAFTQLHNIYI